MINSGDISQRVKAITDELRALKGNQNMSAGGLLVGGRSELQIYESMSYQQADTWRDFILDITITNNTTNVPPIVNIYIFAYPDDISWIRGGEATYCLSASGNKTVWRYKTSYRPVTSGSYTVSGWIILNSLVDATVTYTRVA